MSEIEEERNPWVEVGMGLTKILVSGLGSKKKLKEPCEKNPAPCTKMRRKKRKVFGNYRNLK